MSRTKAAASNRRLALRALIIDDSPIMRRIIRHQLEQLGCTVVGEAESAAAGMRLFTQFSPQLVTLDVMMPEVEGIDTVSAFCAFRRQAPQTAIVVVTSLTVAEVETPFLKEGAVGYLPKTFDDFSFARIMPKVIRAFADLHRKEEDPGPA